MSEVLIKNLSNLTLNPSIKLPFILPECLPQPTGRLLGENIPYRRGVRTVLTDRRDKMERLIQSIKKRYGKGVPRVSLRGLGRQQCPTLGAGGRSHKSRCK